MSDLTTRHIVTVELAVDHGRTVYAPLPENVDDWTPADVEYAITAGHARIVRDGPVTVA